VKTFAAEGSGGLERVIVKGVTTYHDTIADRRSPTARTRHVRRISAGRDRFGGEPVIRDEPIGLAPVEAILVLDRERLADVSLR